MEWAQAHGIRKAVAEKLTADEWKVRVLLSSKDGFVEELCKAGEKRGPAAEIWLKLQSQGTHSIWARDPVLSTLLSSLLLALSLLFVPVCRVLLRFGPSLLCLAQPALSYPFWLANHSSLLCTSLCLRGAR